jgi:hypothetical protein
MYKTAITLPEKIAKSVAALLAGLVALTALSMTPLTASAGTPNDAGVTASEIRGEIRDVVVQYLTEHPELHQAAAPHHHVHGIYVGDSEHTKP